MRSSEEHARLYGTQGQPPRDPADEMDDAEQARVHRRPVGPIHADYCPKERGFTTCLCGGMNHYVTELEKEAMRLAVEVDKLRAELAAAKADGMKWERSVWVGFIMSSDRVRREWETMRGGEFSADDAGSLCSAMADELADLRSPEYKRLTDRMDRVMDEFGVLAGRVSDAESALALSQERGERMRAALVPFAKLADVVAVRGCQLDISAFTAARAALAADAPEPQVAGGDEVAG